ncbi:glutathione S-transferase omega-1-like [Argonauta hians]
MFVQHQVVFKSALQFTVKEFLRMFSKHLSNAVSEFALANGSKCPQLETSTLRLYSMRFCPFAERTRLVLEHKKIPYETVNINLKFKPDWFLKKNPFGRVPVIEHDSKIIYESLICNDYLEKVFPNPPLTPVDPYLLAKDQMLISHMDKIVNMFWKSLRLRKKGEPMDSIMIQLKADLCYFEEQLNERGAPFFGGKQVCMADFNLWPWFAKLEAVTEVIQLCDHFILCDYPKLLCWYENMLLLPEVKASKMETHQDVAFLRGLASGNADYDFGLQTSKSQFK